MKTKSNPTFLPIKDKGTKHGTTSILLAVIVVMSNQVSCIGRLQFSQNKRQRNHRNCSSACSQRSWVSQSNLRQLSKATTQTASYKEFEDGSGFSQNFDCSGFCLISASVQIETFYSFTMVSYLNFLVVLIAHWVVTLWKYD